MLVFSRKQVMIRSVFKWNALFCDSLSPKTKKSVQDKSKQLSTRITISEEIGLDNLWSPFMLWSLFCDLEFKATEMFLGVRNPKIIALSNFSVFILSPLLMSACTLPRKHLWSAGGEMSTQNSITSKNILQKWKCTVDGSDQQKELVASRPVDCL